MLAVPLSTASSEFRSIRLHPPRRPSQPGPPRLFSLSFLGFSIITKYCTYRLYLLTMTKATTNLVKTREDVPQKLRFFPNAGFAIRSNPPILMRWPWVPDPGDGDRGYDRPAEPAGSCKRSLSQERASYASCPNNSLRGSSDSSLISWRLSAIPP